MTVRRWLTTGLLTLVACGAPSESPTAMSPPAATPAVAVDAVEGPRLRVLGTAQDLSLIHI